MKCALGVDTSCYTTSVALAGETGVLCSRRRLLDVAQGARGLRQSEALFQHVQRLPALMEDMFMEAGEAQIACVCASANGELYAEANGGLTILPDAINFPVADEYAGTRVGAPKGETELIEVVNSVIEELNESGQYNEWYDEYAEYAGTLGLD